MTLNQSSTPSNSLHPVYHSIHVLSTLLAVILVFLVLTVPHLHTHPSCSTFPQRFLFPPVPLPSVCQSLDRLPFTYILNHNSLLPQTLSFHRRTRSLLVTCLLLLAGDVEINPGPTPSHIQINPTLNLAIFNIRSSSSVSHLYNKPEILKHTIHDNNIDLFCLTETWLQPDTPQSVINSLLSPNYSFTHTPRLTGTGGGLGVISKNNLTTKNINLPKYSSFEAQSLSFTVSPSFLPGTFPTTLPFILLNIYRPPSSSQSDFLSEFTSLLEDFHCSPSDLIITGDFNLHLDNPSAPYVSSFLDILDTFGLTQHITFPTHESGHTLDLLITRSSSSLVGHNRKLPRTFASGEYSVFRHYPEVFASANITYANS